MPDWEIQKASDVYAFNIGAAVADMLFHVFLNAIESKEGKFQIMGNITRQDINYAIPVTIQ